MKEIEKNFFIIYNHQNDKLKLRKTPPKLGPHEEAIKESITFEIEEPEIPEIEKNFRISKGQVLERLSELGLEDSLKYKEVPHPGDILNNISEEDISDIEETINDAKEVLEEDNYRDWLRKLYSFEVQSKNRDFVVDKLEKFLLP